MNKQRRKDISDKLKIVSEIKDALQKAIDAFNEMTINVSLDDAHGEVEALRDEEQEAFDNMPEGLQQGERGELSQEAINNLETAAEKISEAKEALEGLENTLGEITDALEEAEGAMEEAQA